VLFLFVTSVRIDNLAHERVANDIGTREDCDKHVVHAVKDFGCEF
jgi:hypothetical protein